MKRLKVLKMFKLSKYRRVQENNNFYPEQRFALFFWSRFSIFCKYILFYKDASFNTLIEAETFLRDQLHKETKETIIHEFKY